MPTVDTPYFDARYCDLVFLEYSFDRYIDTFDLTDTDEATIHDTSQGLFSNFLGKQLLMLFVVYK